MFCFHSSKLLHILWRTRSPPSISPIRRALESSTLGIKQHDGPWHRWTSQTAKGDEGDEDEEAGSCSPGREGWLLFLMAAGCLRTFLEGHSQTPHGGEGSSQSAQKSWVCKTNHCSLKKVVSKISNSFRATFPQWLALDQHGFWWMESLSIFIHDYCATVFDRKCVSIRWRGALAGVQILQQNDDATASEESDDQDRSFATFLLQLQFVKSSKESYVIVWGVAPLGGTNRRVNAWDRCAKPK